MEYDKQTAEKIAAKVKELWPGATWTDSSSPHPDTVLLDWDGLWLYISVKPGNGKMRYLMQLYANNTGGVRASIDEDPDYPIYQVVVRGITALKTWDLAVRLESTSKDYPIFEVHYCTDGKSADGTNFDYKPTHAGSCGCWDVHGLMTVHSAFEWRGAPHATVHVNVGGRLRSYAEFVDGKATYRSAEMRRALDEQLAQEATA